MPSPFVRPRASLAPRLSPAGRQGYHEAGWHVRTRGIDAGTVVGPCARCTLPTVRYGRHGHPLCPACRPHARTPLEAS
jgi:hypothetical protein